MRFQRVIWSPIEVEYLKTHRDSDINQLTIALAKTRAAIKRKCDELDGKVVKKKNARRTTIGIRQDIGQFCRSGWEANVIRYFNHKKWKWAYEPKVFSFLEHGVKRGTVTYTPDFKLGTRWVEVKGYLDRRGRTAIRRFKKYYPEEFKKLRAITASPNTESTRFFEEMGVPILAYYNDLNKKYKDVLPHWE